MGHQLCCELSMVRLTFDMFTTVTSFHHYAFLWVSFDLRGFSFLLFSCFRRIKLVAENLSALMWQFNFRGMISSCFELHLTVYVELEEKTLMENLEKLVQVWAYCVFGKHLIVLCAYISCTNRYVGYNRRKRGILKREVRLIFYPVACR